LIHRTGSVNLSESIGVKELLALRPSKNRVDPQRPYAFSIEPERTADGTLADVTTIFLTNRECPFRCLFCDLWKNTTDTRVPVGAIPAQIDYAFAQLPAAQRDAARQIKLYNSGNFFDAQAIPPEDFPAIARRLTRFDTVIVENHPRLCGEACVRFRDQLAPGQQLEVALGLETVHPEILPRLNKQMTLDDFARAAAFLREAHIAVRAFILLQPPFMREDQCVTWALRSLEFALSCGARVCSIIPARGGNGAMERLARDGLFAPPRLDALEAAFEQGLKLAAGRGRVFVDLWDIERLYDCPNCGPRRAARLVQMNHTQQVVPRIDCACGARRAS
jgi:archaeosine synthase beta-subunit